MKIMIFGAGALGSTLGGFLSKYHEVILIGREKHVSAINKRGLKITGLWGKHVFRNMKALNSTDNLSEHQDFILITTKAYDTEEAIKSISHLVGEDTSVVSFQNGIGNEEIITRTFGREKTLGGIAIFGAVLRAPGEVEITVYAGECKVGELAGKSRKAEELAEALKKAGIPVRYTSDVIRDKWMKLFYNSALNPLSAILRVRYGTLGKVRQTAELMKHIIIEAFGVAEAEDIKLEISFEEYMDLFFSKLLPATGEHKSSMLQDIEKGRKTEIDFLNGAIERLGKKHGIDVPYNNSLAALIKFLEYNSYTSDNLILSPTSSLRSPKNSG